MRKIITPATDPPIITVLLFFEVPELDAISVDSSNEGLIVLLTVSSILMGGVSRHNIKRDTIQ